MQIVSTATSGTGSTGWFINRRSLPPIEDVFVGGVLCTLSAWIMGVPAFMVRVRAGAEVKPSPRLAFVLSLIHGKVKYSYYKKKRAIALD